LRPRRRTETARGKKKKNGPQKKKRKEVGVLRGQAAGGENYLSDQEKKKFRQNAINNSTEGEKIFGCREGGGGFVLPKKDRACREEAGR